MLNFQQFTGSASAFKRTISPKDWANEIKATNKVSSLSVSNILKGKVDDARYAIVTLGNGQSATLPVSKKAVVGSPITDYMFGENDKGEWVVVTGSGNNTEL